MNIVKILACSLGIALAASNMGAANPEVYRLNSRSTGEYLFTTDLNEVNTLSETGQWKNEGISWNAPDFGQPVYRLNNPNGFHLYTADLNEILTLTSEYGWLMDNSGDPMFYSGGDNEVYRLYDEATGRHLLTPDKNEYENMASKGWYGEGVAFKAGFVPERKPSGPIVCIDPGHQRRGDSNTEPNGPGSATMKARVTQGTTGRTTGVPEYQLNLDVSLKLRDELESRGYTVVMTRETHDVNISNMERAQFATQMNADITVRIHANGSDDTSVNGALCMVPSSSNPYVSNLATDSTRLGNDIINSFCSATGMKNLGVQKYDNMTGINFCTMPVTILEMGFMTNPGDDRNMQDPGYQQNMVRGIADGIDKYFGR